MEDQKPTTGKFAINYGVILGVILILISVIMYVTGMQLEGTVWPMYLYYIIFPAIIIYTISQYKKKNGNLLSLGEAIKLGLITAIISALVFAAYNMVFNYLIDTEYAGQILDVTRDKLLENPNMTEEQVDKAMSISENFSSPIIGSTIWIALSSVFGLIYSLIAGLVMKSE